MPKKPSEKKKATKSPKLPSGAYHPSLTMGQVRDRSTNVHADSPVYIVGKDVLGFPIRATVKGIRLTMNDNGKRDIVEILV